MTQETVVQTVELSKSFGRQTAVDEVSLTVNRGDIYGFLGLNGAGKTTSLRLILGLLQPDKGRVLLFGRDTLENRVAALRRMGAMVEGPAFYGQLTGAENLQMLGRLSGPITRSRISDVLHLVGLAEAGGKKARDYSLGMKQRLGIALALVSRPELVILDEPTNGLDPSGILEMRRLILEMNRQEGTTFVISSHLLHEIEMICGRVAILERGRLIVEDTMVNLMRRDAVGYQLFAHPVDAALKILTTLGLAATIDDDRRFIRFSADHQRLPEIHRQLSDSGLSIFTLAEERFSLEDYFLRRSSSHTAGKLS